MEKNVYICVTNDLVTDERVDRTAGLLASAGCEVCLLGRKLPHSPGISARSYRTKRFRLLANNGFLFYACFNLRLFLFLITRKHVDLIVANDLDTLAACFFASRLRRTKIVYDSHEYFTEVPELINRKFVRSFWIFMEKLLVPRLELAYTVNRSIAQIYRNKYGTSFQVIRNLPLLKQPVVHFKRFTLPDADRKIVIYQGAINLGRGIEQVIDAVKSMDKVVFIIAGSGDILDEIRLKVRNENLEQKVILTGRLEPEQLRSLTPHAHLGVSVELNLGLNYYYALPNKLFAYIHAGIPVLTSGFPEMKQIVNTYQVGMTIDDPGNIQLLQNTIHLMLNDTDHRREWKQNTRRAARELCWESEQKQLKNIYRLTGIHFGKNS